jgi:hypothetical protein
MTSNTLEIKVQLRLFSGGDTKRIDKLITFFQKLSDDELTELSKYTQGQWSDGIGEGFEQYPCCQSEGSDVYISPWIPGQKLEVIQTQTPIYNLT